jgi:DNA-binding HxlR family transcriptional regulator
MATDPINRGILREVANRPLDASDEHEYRVTSGGREVLFVGFVAERWLQSGPQGPLHFHSPEAAMAVLALAEGWTATVVHMLARGPHTFNELYEAIGDLSGKEIRHHLAALQSTGQVGVLVGEGNEPIYAATDWLQAGIAALIASARLERREPRDDMAPIDALDVEAGFRCSLGLVELPQQLSGICSLGIRLEEDESSSLTGVTVRVDQGRIVSCEAGLDRKANAWAAGTAGDWMDTVIEPDAQLVRSGGDRWLARALIDALHETLFGITVAPD